MRRGPSDVVNHHYTDVAVLLGPDRRAVQNGYRELMLASPETLLGYKVVLSTPNTNLHGYKITKLIHLFGAPWRDQRAITESIFTYLSSGLYITHFEEWVTDPAYGIRRIT